METNNNEKPKGKKLFKPGQVANPNGRPAGVPNKITTQMREAMHELFMNNADRMQEDLDSLEPKDRLIFMTKLFPFFMPTMTATKIEKTVKHTGFEHLGTPELQKLLLKIQIPIDTQDAEYTEQ